MLFKNQGNHTFATIDNPPITVFSTNTDTDIFSVDQVVIAGNGDKYRILEISLLNNSIWKVALLPLSGS